MIACVVGTLTRLTKSPALDVPVVSEMRLGCNSVTFTYHHALRACFDIDIERKHEAHDTPETVAQRVVRLDAEANAGSASAAYEVATLYAKCASSKKADRSSLGPRLDATVVAIACRSTADFPPDYVSSRFEQAAAAGHVHALVEQPSWAPPTITAAWRSEEAAAWQRRINTRLAEAAARGHVDALFALGKTYNDFWAVRDPVAARKHLIDFMRRSDRSNKHFANAQAIIDRLDQELAKKG